MAKFVLQHLCAARLQVWLGYVDLVTVSVTRYLCLKIGTTRAQCGEACRQDLYKFPSSRHMANAPTGRQAG